MKLIKQSFEILEQGNSIAEIYKHIEKCGRTCYKSNDKITDESADPFVKQMINSNHTAMLEHGTIYLHRHWDAELICNMRIKEAANSFFNIYYYNPYSRARLISNMKGWDVYITTNLRVLTENKWLNDLQYICEPTKYHYKRYTVKFICNRQVSHEFVRHRKFSFAQESTRYCNYSKDKFGNELTFIIPDWLDIPEIQTDDVKVLMSLQETSLDVSKFISICLDIQNYYMNSINNRGKLPQQVSTILPNALKTELIMTGFIDDWLHFFDLRALGTTGAPHPQAKELALPLMMEFKRRKYIS